MSDLTFNLKHIPAQRVDLSPLSCQLISELSTSEINAITLISGKRRLRVDKLFDVSGDNAEHIVFKHSCDKLDYIGRDMERGNVIVEGNVGAYLGMSMKGGKIAVTGNAGIFAACEMEAGLIQINGNVNDFLGGALPGNKKGMRGGLVVVKGNAGARVGDSMRRGTILVEGNVSDYCGSRMIAGTIAVMGTTGKHLGYAMNRGTLLLWESLEIPQSFVSCGALTSSSFLPLLFRSFRKLDSKFADPDMEFHRVALYSGDMSALGRGEIMVKIG